MWTDYLNILVLFIIVGLGYFLAAKSWLTRESNQLFVKLIIRITLPFMLLLDITKDFTKEEFIKLIPFICLPLLTILSLMALSWLYEKVARVPKKRFGLFIVMCSIDSVVFMGIPICLAVFGRQSLPYALLYFVSSSLVFWTLGVYLLQKDRVAYEKATSQFHWQTFIKNLFSPPLIGFLLGVFLLLFGIPLPHFLETFASSLGAMTSPMAMLVIGTLVYLTGLKQLKWNKDTFVVLLFRFVLSPIIVFLWSLVLPVSPLMVKVTILQSALPIQNTTVILADEYQTDITFGTTSLSYSIIVYLFVVPILLWFVNMI